MPTWDAGGVIGPELAVATRAIARGHKVHVIADPTVADIAKASGCTFSPWRRAPFRPSLELADDVLKDWEIEDYDPFELLRRLRDRIMSGPAADFAADTADAIEQFQPDAVVPDSQLFGAIIAAQQAGLPVAALVPNVWVFPTPGTVDTAWLTLANRVVRPGLVDLNATRADRGLTPLSSFYDQLLNVQRILVLSSETFDYASLHVPSNVRYVGPILDDPKWAEPWQQPWPASNKSPLVLVGFSSTYQNQGELVQKVINALSSMDVRAVVTLGQALDASELVAAPNVIVVPSAPHSVILNDASVVVSHAGHGTTMKTLSAGVPLVCLPMGRDQDITAERVVHLGAGIQLPRSASSTEIAQAITEVMDNPEFRTNALRMATTIAEEHKPDDVVVELESLVE
jgi:MGT family glycosyltransferase